MRNYVSTVSCAPQVCSSPLAFAQDFIGKHFALAATLSLIVLSHPAASADYQTGEGENGELVISFPVLKDVDLLIADCDLKNDAYTFSVIVTVGDDVSDLMRKKITMSDKLMNRPNANVSGQVCLGTTCRDADFGWDDYTGGPYTSVTFAEYRMASSKSIAVKLPNGISLKWEGDSREAFEKICKKPTAD